MPIALYSCKNIEAFGLFIVSAVSIGLSRFGGAKSVFRSSDTYNLCSTITSCSFAIEELTRKVARLAISAAMTAIILARARSAGIRYETNIARHAALADTHGCAGGMPAREGRNGADRVVGSFRHQSEKTSAVRLARPGAPTPRQLHPRPKARGVEKERTKLNLSLPVAIRSPLRVSSPGRSATTVFHFGLPSRAMMAMLM